MTENLDDVLRAITELGLATQNVIRAGWPEADGLWRAIQENARYLATGHNGSDNFTTARVAAHWQCLACLEAYNAALDAPGRHEPQEVFVGHAQLLSERLFDVRQCISVHWR